MISSDAATALAPPWVVAPQAPPAALAPRRSRRDFLATGMKVAVTALVGAGLGGGLVGTVSYVEQRYMARVWRANSTRLTAFGSARTPSPEGWVVVPGFDSRDGSRTAGLLDRALGGQAPVAYLTFSDSGTALDDVASLLSAYSAHLRSQSYDATLSIYGVSMGGPVAMASAAGLGVPIQRVVLESSPFDMADARLGTLGRLLADSGYRGGVVGDYVTNLANDERADGILALPVDVVKAAIEVPSAPSPRLWASQISLMQTCGETLGGAPAGAYAGVLGPATRALYCGPSAPAADATVNEVSAARRWAAFLGRFGARLDRLGLEGVGHADTHATLTSSHVSDWLGRTAPAAADLASYLT